MPRLEGAVDGAAVMHTSSMKRANGSPVGDRSQDTIGQETLAGILGPPPRLPDPGKGWDELVEKAAAAEFLARQRRESDGSVDEDD